MSKVKKTSPLVLTLISIFFGLLVGALLLAVAGYNPARAYSVILGAIFGKPKYIAYTIIYATPLIVTGLSVAFAFRTGLFNIGAEGQFIIGSLVAALAGAFLPLPPVLHVIVVFLLAGLAAALWGGLAGFLKARFGIHEVIGTIMLNWVAFYLNNFIVLRPAIRRSTTEATHYIADTARTEILGVWKLSEGGMAWRQANPFFMDLFKAPVNVGILIALLLALAVWFILNKTTLGYELRAVGFNSSAAEYGGINVRKSMITSMAIAGGLAGLAGAMQVSGVTRQAIALAATEGYGFDGIAVALIGASTPIGCVLAGLLFGALKYGGPSIQLAMGAPQEVIDIMIGTIVFFVAMPKLIRLILSLKNRMIKKKIPTGENPGGEAS